MIKLYYKRYQNNQNYVLFYSELSLSNIIYIIINEMIIIDEN